MPSGIALLWRVYRSRTGFNEMVYVAIVGIVLGLALALIVLRYTLFSPVPRTITSLSDAERLVNYHIDAANRRLRRDAWMLTFVVSHLDPENHTVMVRIGINYRRRGILIILGNFNKHGPTRA